MWIKPHFLFTLNNKNVIIYTENLKVYSWLSLIIIFLQYLRIVLF
jgi:hypothetical protein